MQQALMKLHGPGDFVAPADSVSATVVRSADEDGAHRDVGARHLRGDADVLRIPALERRRLQSHILIMLSDVATILAAFVLGAMILFQSSAIPHALTQAQIILPLFLTFGLYNGSYSIAALRSQTASMARPAQALALAALAMVLLTYLSGTASANSRLVFMFGVLTSAILLPLTRFAARSAALRHCGGRFENVMIVVDGGPPVATANAFVADAAAEDLRPDITDPHALDRLGRWFADMDRVLVSCDPARRAAWAQALKGLAVEAEVLDRTVAELGALGARHDGQHGFLLVSHRPLGLRARAIKRLFDLAITIPALILLAPLLIAVSLAIRLQDGGPALFVQERTGRASRFFRIFKFRSMRVAQSDRRGDRSTARDDERVTRLGRFLRRTSIDELPQLFNVLKGDMSLVGPRPHAIGSQAGDKLFWEVDQRYWQRHNLKPGLTGLAQVRGHRGATEDETALRDRLQSDLEYLDGWTVWRDIGILFATLRVVVHDRAY